MRFWSGNIEFIVVGDIGWWIARGFDLSGSCGTGIGIVIFNIISFSEGLSLVWIAINFFFVEWWQKSDALKGLFCEFLWNYHKITWIINEINQNSYRCWMNTCCNIDNIFCLIIDFWVICEIYYLLKDFSDFQWKTGKVLDLTVFCLSFYFKLLSFYCLLAKTSKRWRWATAFWSVHKILFFSKIFKVKSSTECSDNFRIYS